MEIFSDGLAVRTGNNNKKGYINPSGEFVIEPIYMMAGHFSEGFAGVSLDYVKIGFVDTSGEMVISPAFLSTGKFNNGLAPAQDYDSMNWGFIDKQGKWIIRPEFFHAGDFSGDCAPVSKNGHEWRLINRKGDFVSATYKDIVAMKSGLSLPGSSLQGSSVLNGLMRKDAPLSLLIKEREIEDLFWTLTVEGWIIIDSKDQEIISEPQPSRVAFN